MEVVTVVEECGEGGLCQGVTKVFLCGFCMCFVSRTQLYMIMIMIINIPSAEWSVKFPHYFLLRATK